MMGSPRTTRAVRLAGLGGGVAVVRFAVFLVASVVRKSGSEERRRGGNRLSREAIVLGLLRSLQAGLAAAILRGLFVAGASQGSETSLERQTKSAPKQEGDRTWGGEKSISVSDADDSADGVLSPPRELARRARRAALFGGVAGLLAVVILDPHFSFEVGSSVSGRRRRRRRLRVRAGNNALTTVALHLAVRAAEMVARAGAAKKLYDDAGDDEMDADGDDLADDDAVPPDLNLTRSVLAAAEDDNLEGSAVMRALPRWLRLPHIPSFEVWTFQAACSFIMSFWFFAPESLPAVYRAWITEFADMDTRLLEGLRAFRDGRARYGEHSDLLRSYCIDNGVPILHGDPVMGFIPCSTVHPLDGMSCNRNALRRFARGTRRALFLYVPVHLISLAFQAFGKEAADERRRRKQEEQEANMLLDGDDLEELEMVDSDRSGELTRRRREPRFTAKRLRRVLALFASDLPKAMLGATRSAAFLGSFIAIIWRTICFVRFVAGSRFGHELTLGPVLGSCLCGLSLFVEKATRRAELACYVVPRCLQSIWDVARRKRVVFDVPFFDAALVSASSACFLYFFTLEKERRPGEPFILRPLFRSVLGLLVRPTHGGGEK